MVTITGADLTPAQLLDVIDSGAPLSIDPAARARAAASRDTVLEVLTHQAVYGRTTGVGANQAQPLQAPQAAGDRLVRSHAGGGGELVGPRVARAMLVVRANQLLAAGAGVDPALIEVIVVAVNAGAYPTLHSVGSIGTGDLTALAELALTITGERPWIGDGPPPVMIDSLDALALLSSSALTIAGATLVQSELAQLADAALVVAALSVVALRGSVEPFALAVALGRPYAGSNMVAERMRALLDPPPERSDRTQDPYGIRALPPVHGVLLDALQRVRDSVTIELNAATENPLVSTESGAVFHHGNFHQAPLAAALDAVRLALLSSAQLGATRISSLLEPTRTGLAPFLANGPSGSSGLMIVEYTAASALAAMRSAATPVTGGVAVISRGAEEHASFAPQGVRQTVDAVAAYRLVLAAELVTAVRALSMSARVPASPKLRAAYDFARAALPTDTADRPLDIDLAAADRLLDAIDSLPPAG